ncbi:MAG: ASPIC/UnbV domain-containing protein, partial [Saprospiraceae bacterium]
LAVANCFNANQPNSLYENHSAVNGNNWLQVNLVGTTSNRSAIGAKVLVTATINGQQVTQLREISAQSGYCGQNQLAAHFGLSAANLVSVQVLWPSGLEELYGNISANQHVTVTEGQGVVGVDQPLLNGPTRALTVQPNPSSDSVTVVWEQQEAETVQLRLLGAQSQVFVSQSIDATPGRNTWRWDGKIPAGNYAVQVQGTNWKATGILVRTGH